MVALASAGVCNSKEEKERDHGKSPQKSNDNAVKTSEVPNASKPPQRKNVFKTKSQDVIPSGKINEIVDANKVLESTSSDYSRDARISIAGKRNRISKIDWEEYESTLSKK